VIVTDWQHTLRHRLARLPLEQVRSQLDLEALMHCCAHRRSHRLPT
jgi:hypothetical protein